MPECPVEAIFHEDNVPRQWTPFIQLNADRVAILNQYGGRITERQDPKESIRCVGVAR